MFAVRGVVQCGHFADNGCPHLLVQKTPDFSKFMVCPHGEGGRGLRQCGDFTFSRFCADVLYGRPLIKLIKTDLKKKSAL